MFCIGRCFSSAAELASDLCCFILTDHAVSAFLEDVCHLELFLSACHTFDIGSSFKGLEQLSISMCR